MFFQSVLYLALSVFVYALLAVSEYAVKRMNNRSYADVIAMCDIYNGGYGSVFYRNGNYILKNTFGSNIKKGQVLRIDKSLVFNDVNTEDENV